MTDAPGTPPLRAALHALMAEHGPDVVQAAARSVAAELTLEQATGTPARSVTEAGQGLADRLRGTFAVETTFVRAGADG